MGVYRVGLEGGTSEYVVDDYFQGGYVLSQDGRLVAFSGGGLFDLAQGSWDHLDHDGRPLRFSPDGTEFVISYGGDLFFYSVEERTSELWEEQGGDDDLTWLPVEIQLGLTWEPDRIELVTVEEDPEASEDEEGGPGFLVVVRDGSGVTRTVTADEDLEYLGVATGTLSPDGTQAAIWFDGWGLDSGENQLVLVLVDMASGSTQTIGALQEQVNGVWWPPNWPYTMAFSPDGRHLAYVWGDALYVKAIP
jgi:hypothetical protein